MTKREHQLQWSLQTRAMVAFIIYTAMRVAIFIQHGGIEFSKTCDSIAQS